MSLINNFKEFSFAKIAIVSGLLFFMIVLIIELFLSLIKSETLSEITSKVLSPDFIIVKIAGAVVYGLVIAFFYKRKQKRLTKR